MEAIEFFSKPILIQEYVAHVEQVYKIYTIGPDWFGCDVRRSVPDKLINSVDPLIFDSQVKFDHQNFTDFDKTTDRLNYEKTK